MHRHVAFWIGLGGLAGVCAADITPRSIQRQIRGTTQARFENEVVNDSVKTVTSDEFGVFVEDGSARSETADDTASAQIMLAQDTEASPEAIRGQVRTAIQAEAVDGGEGNADGWSFVRYSFEIDRSAQFFLRGSFIEEVQTGSTPNRSSVRLLSFVDGVDSIFFNDPDQQDFSFNGELLAGRYDLLIETRLSAQANNANGLLARNDMTINFTFGLVECAADLDGDGDADADDFFAYLDLFAGGDDRADVDGDGDLDADDFFAYLDLFTVGCP